MIFRRAVSNIESFTVRDLCNWDIIAPLSSLFICAKRFPLCKSLLGVWALCASTFRKTLRVAVEVDSKKNYPGNQVQGWESVC